MSKEECYTCSDRLNYVKLCEKYDQLESVYKVLVEDNLTYENQIADLEEKLAEKEKENELMAKTLKMTKFVEKEIDQDKISFAVEQLEKVKEEMDLRPRGVSKGWKNKEYDTLVEEDVYEVIDNQIKQLKEMK